MVGEVAGAGGHHGRAFAHLGLVAHAQRATRHFGARTCHAKRGVMPFFDEFALVHLGGWCQAQPCPAALANPLLPSLTNSTQLTN